MVKMILYLHNSYSHTKDQFDKICTRFLRFLVSRKIIIISFMRLQINFAKTCIKFLRFLLSRKNENYCIHEIGAD